MDERLKSRVYISSRLDPYSEHVEGITQEVISLVGEQGFFAETHLLSSTQWSAETRRVLHETYAMIVIIGPDWLRTSDEYGRRKLDDPDDNIRNEIETAIDLKLHIIPLLLHDTYMPPAKAFPNSLQRLTEIKYLREDPEKTWKNKLRAILSRSRKGQVNDELPKRGFDYQILSIELTNFKCFEHFLVDFQKSNLLSGQWTCIAGINGSGKSTILQAIALVLMGPRQAAELGGRRLDSFRRIDANGKKSNAMVRARMRSFDKVFQAELMIDEKGLDVSNSEDWTDFQGSLFAGYGASRNVSASHSRRENPLSASVDRFISLFDPMAPLNSAEGIFLRAGADTTSRETLEIKFFASLIERIFPHEIVLRRHVSDNRIEFRSGDAFHEVSGLPDGYRSSVAWIADLAVSLAELNPSDSLVDVSNVSGIVLVDEIELHLHATMQRSIVPRLRSVLPKIQWIVTTHSPLVISSFDRNEVIPLDEDFDTGIKDIDHQVLGLTADQIYEYVFDTPPSSEAAEELLETLSRDPNRLKEFDAIIERASEGITSDKLDEIQRRLGKIRRENY